MAKRDTLETAKNILTEIYKDDVIIVSRIASAYYDNNRVYIADSLETLIDYLKDLKSSLNDEL